ncbi:MAG TPA: cell division FtsA domain-containing protein [Chloroflexota bacterium]|nr:cell division FtsA domain-containing protein [Chloroflexota bacterium]
MQLAPLKNLFRRTAPGAYAALDIGTEYAKALVFSVEDGKGTVLGIGRHRQSQSAMQDGLITDIEAVVQHCHAALSQAEEMAGVVGKHAIVGLAGELVKGMSTTITVEREHPTEKLDLEEIEHVMERVQRLALERVTERLTWEMGLPSVDVRLVNTAVVAIKIDGHQISNPVGFQGRHLQISVFNAFAPLVHVGASETIARLLSLELLSVVAEPYAVASCLDSPAAIELGGIFIDVGGGTTDVALVRNGGIEGTQSFALGGRAFTRRLAIDQGLSLEEAEELKLRYARKETTPAQTREVRKALDRDVTTWMDGVQLILEELAGDGQLPPYVYLCGGASALPDIMERLKAFPWTERLPCPRPAQITVLKPSDVSSMTDASGGLVDQQDMTPLGLAFQVLALQRQSSLINEALVRAVRMLKL